MGMCHHTRLDFRLSAGPDLLAGPTLCSKVPPSGEEQYGGTPGVASSCPLLALTAGLSRQLLEALRWQLLG